MVTDESFGLGRDITREVLAPGSAIEAFRGTVAFAPVAYDTKMA